MQAIRVDWRNALKSAENQADAPWTPTSEDTIAMPRPTVTPRPTAAQLAYGSCTVICSTLAMLLLSQTSSGVGIAIIALAALALGLLVAMTVPMPRSRVVAVNRPATQAEEPQPAATPQAPVPATASIAAAASERPVHERAAS
jgi:hypothetical protein